MRTLKMNESHAKEFASKDMIESAMHDFVKEQDDMRATDGTNMRVLRPPKTVMEAIDTLKQADGRYQQSKPFLYGVDSVVSKPQQP